ncbi:AraC family transcriptional regulator [Rubrivirga sp. S365]|uniref:AraC family transcriptional regulator n=1 Tax=Rubrivirga litoralis TaxID=3075598 RepID=A0ABU3BPM3_9BACT|nr:MULTISPECIES: AraC family transcriptional regulator [unclassified Rubrivirga]MDT0631161.1 AraC family transcriptional regulator [Rubrivirga sp. F394]MDT7856696.1 AraC family transcriptional regulator [Rubrivirga sp. S365]
MDPLSLALAATDVRSVAHVAAELSGPWALQASPEPGQADLVLVSSGTAVVEAAGGTVTLDAGAGAVLPRSVPYVVRSPRGAATAAVAIDAVTGACPAERFERVRHDAQGQENGAPSDGVAPDHVVLGSLLIEDTAASPLIAALPPALVLPPEAAPWASQTLALIADESQAGRPGASAVAARLAEVFLLQTVRAYVEGLPEVCPDGGDRSSWLHALADPDLGRALLAIHRAPEHPWTVEALAAEAYMSRTTFATRFTEAVGTPPLRYVASWRLHKAARSLRRGAAVFEAAADAGYGSKASFSKAFKRATGVSPSEYGGDGAAGLPEMGPYLDAVELAPSVRRGATSSS